MSLYEIKRFILGYFAAYRISKETWNQDWVLLSQEQRGWQKMLSTFWDSAYTHASHH